MKSANAAKMRAVHEAAVEQQLDEIAADYLKLLEEQQRRDFEQGMDQLKMLEYLGTDGNIHASREGKTDAVSSTG